MPRGWGLQSATGPGPTGPLWDPQLQLLQPHKGTGPPHCSCPFLRMQCVWSCMASPLLFFPQPLLHQSHGLGMYMSGQWHTLFGAHFNQKAVWCPGVAQSGQWERHLFLYLLPNFFFPYVVYVTYVGLCHSGNMRNLSWLPTELGYPTIVPVSPKALYSCSCIRPLPLSICDPYGFTRQKPSSFSHMHPERLRFLPQLLALCLPTLGPTASSHPRVQGWFLPSQTTASRTRLHQSGASPCQVTSGAAHCWPLQPPGPPYTQLSGCSSPKNRCGSNTLIVDSQIIKVGEKNQGEIWAEQLLRCWEEAVCMRDLLLSHGWSTAGSENTEAETLL